MYRALGSVSAQKKNSIRHLVTQTDFKGGEAYRRKWRRYVLEKQRRAQIQTLK
jgi:hypothetical protein